MNPPSEAQEALTTSGVCGETANAVSCSPLGDGERLVQQAACDCSRTQFTTPRAPTWRYKGTSCELGNFRRIQANGNDCIDTDDEEVSNDYAVCGQPYDFNSCLGYRSTTGAAALNARLQQGWTPCWAFAPNPTKVTFTDPAVLLETTSRDARSGAGAAMGVFAAILVALLLYLGYLWLKHSDKAQVWCPRLQQRIHGTEATVSAQRSGAQEQR